MKYIINLALFITLFTIKSVYCGISGIEHNINGPSVAYHPSGTLLACVKKDAKFSQNLCISNLITQQDTIFKNDEVLIFDLMYNPDGSQLAISDSEMAIKILDTTTNQCIAIVDLDDYAECLAYAPDNSSYASGHWAQKKYIQIRDPKSNTCTAELKEHTDHIPAIAYNPTNCNELASCSGDETVKIWDLRTNKSTTTLPYVEDVHYLAYNPTKPQELAIGSWNDKPTTICNTQTQQCIRKLIIEVYDDPWDRYKKTGHFDIVCIPHHNNNSGPLVYNPDGSQFISRCYFCNPKNQGHNHITVRDTKNYEEISPSYCTTNKKSRIMALAYNPKKPEVACSAPLPNDTNIIVLWNLVQSKNNNNNEKNVMEEETTTALQKLDLEENN